MEAQLRWRHPDLGEIPPSEFLPLAERAGLIGELLRWAIEETARTAAGLPAESAPLRIGVKIPYAYLQTGAVVTDVEHALQISGLAAERLVLKVNGSTVMSDDERAALDVASLRLLGVHVALDDFGSGSSALAHLTRLPIDVVTLDRSLITRIDKDPQSRALCESIVGIAKALGLDVVATGVETPAQLAALCGFSGARTCPPSSLTWPHVQWRAGRASRDSWAGHRSVSTKPVPGTRACRPARRWGNCAPSSSRGMSGCTVSISRVRSAGALRLTRASTDASWPTRLRLGGPPRRALHPHLDRPGRWDLLRGRGWAGP